MLPPSMFRSQETRYGRVVSGMKTAALLASVVAMGTMLFLFISSKMVSGKVIYVVFCDIARP